MLSTKLRALRKRRQYTQSDLARFLGVTQQAIAKWESGLSFPDPEMIVRLAGFFEVTSDYLLGIADALLGRSFSHVKIIGTVKAGFDAVAFEEDFGTAVADVSDGEQYRYLVVKGDSMEPYIREGDLALVRVQPNLNSGDLGVVIYKDEEATLKQYYMSGETVTLKPFNEAYKTMTIKGPDLNDLAIFGKVIKTVTSW